ncbi:hypothetical protein [Streptomyces sp. yr375]|nr:hypothetical protein [Streptomyces sp. yr375]
MGVEGVEVRVGCERYVPLLLGVDELSWSWLELLQPPAPPPGLSWLSLP